jgi:cyclopropane-fatty-acyl-phospholipid synthase
MAGDPPLQLVLWDGEQVNPATTSSAGRLRIADRATLWKLIVDPLFQFGEAYSNGKLEIDGELGDVLAVIYKSMNSCGGIDCVAGYLSKWLHRPRRDSLARARDNIHQHYDLGNDFYQLWLDDQMTYTCAYFAEPTFTLEQAQQAKLEHVCRKLDLQPGETVIEAGCGWGSLAIYMARNYGVNVTAYNISHEQINYARERARVEGLDDRIEFIESDWRKITGRCDAFVSVGMLEHVGRQNYCRLGQVIDRCLSPNGRGLIHSIGNNKSQQFNPWLRRRIFPGAYAPCLREMMDIFEPCDFAVLDVENLRPHYARTLRCWLERFEQAAEKIRDAYDEKFVRMWRLYLAGSMANFEVGNLQLYQIAFNRADCTSAPWTRAALYARPYSVNSADRPVGG